MTNSQQLLADYVRNGSDEVFRELVARYLPLVYSTAIRLVGGDTHRAEDVAQMVFLDLARKARMLPEDVMLGGWLHRATCFVASKTMRSERRRQSRERCAVEMNSLQNQAELDLTRVAPMLDEAINQLGAQDRTAILLRYFEQRDLRAVGQALGSNEDAARMRVNRALEKLHVLLKHRGVTLSVAALGTVLATQAVTAAPAGLAGAIASGALAGAAAGTGATLALLKFMTMTNLKFGLSALVIAGATTVLVVQHQAHLKLSEENESLRQKVGQLTTENERLAKRPRAPRLPAPPMRPADEPNTLPAEDLPSTNLYARFKDKTPRLTAEQVEAYLKANGRKSSSLLAAYRTSGDPALLKEAMEKFPNDPHVAFEAVFSKDLSPEQQRQWLNSFEQAAPDNALANYLSAFNYFKSDQADQAVQEVAAAAGKQYQDYTLSRIQDDEEAYLSAGYSVAEAETISSRSLEVPQLPEVKQLGRDMIDLANAYTQSGDPSSAQTTLQMAMNLGQNCATGSTSAAIVGQLVGLSVENLALNAMDPNSPYGGNGQTVQDQINQIAQQRAAISELQQQAKPLIQTMSDQDWINFTDRRMLFGEQAAWQWVVSKYGQN